MAHTRIDGYLIHFYFNNHFKIIFFIHSRFVTLTYLSPFFHLIWSFYDEIIGSKYNDWLLSSASADVEIIQITIEMIVNEKKIPNNWNTYYQIQSLMAANISSLFYCFNFLSNPIVDGNSYIRLSLKSAFHSLIVTLLKLINNQWEKVTSKGRIDVKHSS